MPPRDPKPASSRRKPKPKLDVQEPALTNMLETGRSTVTYAGEVSARKPSKPSPAGPGITPACCLKKPKGAKCLVPREARNRP